MSEQSAAVEDMRYNPATASFEGLVTFDAPEGRTRVAAEYPAPLDADYDAAIEGLRAAAINSLDRPSALLSRTRTRRKDMDRSARGTLAPIRELFGHFFGNRAA